MHLLMADVISQTREEGTRLPREAELAREFQVSRGVIREALRALEERGLVEVRHGHGTVVTPPRDWKVLDPEVLSVILQSEARADVLVELFECRRILEIEAAGLAALRANDDDLVALFEAAARTRTTAARASINEGAEQSFLQADIDFHKAILNVARNRVLSEIAGSLQRALVATRSTFTDRDTRLQRVTEHVEIVDAIAARDPARARGVMTNHLKGIEGILSAQLENQGHDGTPAAVSS